MASLCEWRISSMLWQRPWATRPAGVVASHTPLAVQQVGTRDPGKGPQDIGYDQLYVTLSKHEQHHVIIEHLSHLVWIVMNPVETFQRINI